MTTRLRRAFQSALALGLLLLCTGCTAAAPIHSFEDSVHSLQPPFLSAWQRAGGDALGPPRSGLLWFDERKVQLFDTARLELHEPHTSLMSVVPTVHVQPQPSGWLANLPPAVLATQAAAHRATLAVAGAQGAARPVAQPLVPLTLTLALDTAYSGPLELRLFDRQLTSTLSQTVHVEQGQATFTVLPRGAPGPQWALLLIDNRLAGVRSSLFVLEPVTSVQTGDALLDSLYPQARNLMEGAVVNYTLDDERIRGYRSPDNPLIWLRDHVYQGRGFRYFEPDMTSALDAFRRAQRPDGSFPDVLTYPRLGVQAHRLEPESDVEFLFIQGVYDAWQVTGDDAWMARKLPAMRAALAYITSDPLRWDADLGLVRRPFTLDTWDFQFGPTTTDPETGQPAPRHWIDEQTIWGIFHGDNTGLAYAMRLLARMETHLGNADEAAALETRWPALLERLDTLSWNGDFYTHFVPLEGELPDVGVDTDRQLSLSNAYALNRELLSTRRARRVIETYFARRDFDRAFAEWYSIDPPFPPGSFGMAGRMGENPGEYVNGGIMPLVGGELARGAFHYGHEAYGLDILRRYADLITLTGASYLWYHPTGQAGISGPDTLSTDGWGAGAMIGALLEGAAGITDASRRYRSVEISPRWGADSTITTTHVVARYAASTGYVAYTWEHAPQQLTLDVTGTWQQARLRLLLPPDAPDTLDELTVLHDGRPVAASMRKQANSRYVIVPVSGGDARVTLRWQP